MRKFEFVNRLNRIKDSDADGPICMKLPQRSTAKSAGYDFFCCENVVCKSHQITLVPTGIKAQFPDDETLLLFNRSSNPKKKGLIIINRCSGLWIAISIIMQTMKEKLADYFTIC